MDTTTAPLTLAQRRVFAGLSTTQARDAYQVRDAIGAPSTTSARENVEAVLTTLVNAGAARRQARPGVGTVYLAAR
jgi:hypothetical protein